jgi:hypothetical protein
MIMTNVCHLNFCRCKYILIVQLKDESLNVQEQDEHNNFISHRKGYGSIFAVAEQEEK